MKLTFKSEWFSWLCIALGIGIAVWAYPKLPARVPSHWNIAGHIDGWTTPGGHIWLFFGLIVFLYIIFTAIPFLEPRKENLMKSIGFLVVIKNYMIGMFTALFGVISYMSITDKTFDISRFLGAAMGILFILIGNYLGQVKSNYFMGIRTPWTLSSDSIWQKTHRLGSILFVIAGSLFIIGVVLPSPWNFAIPMIGVLAAALVPVIYSYILFRNGE